MRAVLFSFPLPASVAAHEYKPVSVQTFAFELSRRNLHYSLVLPDWLETQVQNNPIVKKFQKANYIGKGSTHTEYVLARLQREFSEILFLVDLQTKLASRSDLTSLGAITALNFNRALQKVIRLLFEQVNGDHAASHVYAIHRSQVIVQNFGDSLFKVGYSLLLHDKQSTLISKKYHKSVLQFHQDSLIPLDEVKYQRQMADIEQFLKLVLRQNRRLVWSKCHGLRITCRQILNELRSALDSAVKQID